MTTVQDIIKKHITESVGTVLIVSGDRTLLQSFDNFKQPYLTAEYNNVTLIQKNYRRGDLHLVCAGMNFVGVILLEKVDASTIDFIRSRIRGCGDNKFMSPSIIEITELDDSFVVKCVDITGYTVDKL